MKKVKAGFEIITKETEKEMLQEMERVARTCYKSEDKITDDSCYNFIKGIIKRGHEAMIEFSNITVKFTCDRGVSHEIVRHRLANYAQESTRYCNYSKDKYDNQVSFIDISNGINLDLAMNTALNNGTLTKENIDLIINEWEEACKDAEKHYLNLSKLGASPNISRSVLPNSIKTEINVRMDIREWRHFFSLRCEDVAHPQMREIAKPLLKEMAKRYPIFFKDLADKLL